MSRLPTDINESIIGILANISISDGKHHRRYPYRSKVVFISRQWRRYINARRFASVTFTVQEYFTDYSGCALAELMESKVWSTQDSIAHNVQELAITFWWSVKEVSYDQFMDKDSLISILKAVFRTPHDHRFLPNKQNPGYKLTIAGGDKHPSTNRRLPPYRLSAVSKDIFNALVDICANSFLSSLHLENMVGIPSRLVASPSLEVLYLDKAYLDNSLLSNHTFTLNTTHAPLSKLHRLTFNTKSGIFDMLAVQIPSLPTLTELRMNFEHTSCHTAAEGEFEQLLEKGRELVHQTSNTLKLLTLYFTLSESSRFPHKPKPFPIGPHTYFNVIFGELQLAHTN